MTEKHDRIEAEAHRLTARHGDIYDSIAEILAGEDAALQSTVIADLLATWLAGHFSPGGGSETNMLREALLQRHIELVRRLLVVNAKRTEAIYKKREH